MALLQSAFAFYPALGISLGLEKTFNRVDLPRDDYDAFVETKGPRFAWARATVCPCKGLNTQTQQANPSCLKCSGLGWRYFRPTIYAPPPEAGIITPHQQNLIDKARGVVIRAVIVGVGTNPTMFEALGPWGFGAAQVTVRSANRLGYYDRLVCLDDMMAFSEIIETQDLSTIKTRYPPLAINFLASDAAEFSDADVTLDDIGTVQWKAGRAPPRKTRITIHYLCRPVWAVIEFANLTRTSLIKERDPAPVTPLGSPLALPLRAIVRLEHLPMYPKGSEP